MRNKKVLIFIIIITLLIILYVIGGLPFATEKINGSEVTLNEINEAEKYWLSNPLTDEELKEFNSIITSNKVRDGLSKLDKEEVTDTRGMEIKDIKLSEHFSLSRRVEINRGSKTKQTHVTWAITGIMGIELYRYTLYGNFWYDGKTSKVSNAEATGSTSYPGWSKTSSSAKPIGATSTGIWTFQYYIGISPIGMNLRTMEYGANLYCDKVGKIYSRTW